MVCWFLWAIRVDIVISQRAEKEMMKLPILACAEKPEAYSLFYRTKTEMNKMTKLVYRKQVTEKSDSVEKSV